MKRVVILGATGSIGSSALDIISAHPQQFEVLALSGGRNVERMRMLIAQHAPKYAFLSDKTAAQALKESHPAHSKTILLTGKNALSDMATLSDADIVISAIVGTAGLEPTFAAVKAGQCVLLANKESLVASGALMMNTLATSGGSIIPLDSEHNALFQVMPDGYRVGERPIGVRHLHLTASGGPFRLTPDADLSAITPMDALKHPNWNMGSKITIDSASMMNKGLEVIEAHWLFAMPPSNIKVIVHPQSVVHSLVEYIDGSFLAQCGAPDMRIPIAHALGYPNRLQSDQMPLSLTALGNLQFEEPDLNKFPCLQFAFDALALSAGAPCVLNAANEVAVQAFLNERIGFMDIPRIIEQAMSKLEGPVDSLEAILELDKQARIYADTLI